MPTLQVKVSGRQLEQLKEAARGSRCTQSEFVCRWLDGLAAAGGAAMPAAMPAMPAMSGDGVIGVLMEQTELLRRIAERLAPSPAGSAIPEEGGVRPVVLTEGAPMGGDESEGFDEGVARDEIAEGGEEERERGERKALELLEERERLEKVQEMWLRNVEAGGDPCAPPGYEGMSEEEAREMGEKCLKVLRIDVVDEVLDQLLRKWADG